MKKQTEKSRNFFEPFVVGSTESLLLKHFAELFAAE